jgi:hypothetical protein
MTPQEGMIRQDPMDAISRRDRWLVAVWAAWLVLIYSLAGYFGARQLEGYRAQSEAERQERLNAVMNYPGADAPTAGAAAADSPVNVSAGIRLRRIGGFSLKEAEWTANFDIWFRWSGESVHPGETFEVVNGNIEKRDLVESYVRDGLKYERYRVTARMVKQFDPSRFPLADEGLPIEIQDSRHDASKLRYIADERGTGLSPGALPRSINLKRVVILATLRRLDGNTTSPSETEVVRPRLVFGILVSSKSNGLYLMMVQALFASVVVGMIAFFIRPIHVDPRFGIPLGAFFAIVANNIFISSLLPPAERITLTGMVNAVGLATIFLILVQSAVSLHLADRCGRGRLSRIFDRVSFAVLLPCYLGINLLLPWAAMPS